MKRTILLVTIGVALFSCQTKKAVLATDFKSGVYSGTLPCEDCNGINQVIILDSGNTFRLSETYVGKSDKPQLSRGSWKTQEGKLILYSDTNTIAQYAVMGNNLLYLDKQVLNYSAGKNSPQLARRTFVRSKEINKKYLQGLDLVGVGTDDNWSLDIHHRKGVQFTQSPTSSPVTWSSATPELIGDSLIYTIDDDKEKIRIVYAPGFCVDGNTGNLYDYKTTLTKSGKTFNGCGGVTNADGSLDGTWELVWFEDGSKNWQKQPYLSIDLSKEKFFGNTGCNNIHGTARLRGLKVCFSDINPGLKTCTGFDESLFIDALIKCNGFTITKNLLELTQDGKLVIKFIRQE
jgi:uncharacterized membrane protein/heat shock protein HslJ